MIRTTLPGDVPALAAIADATELFPGEMLPDLVAGHLAGEPDGGLWLTCEEDGRAVGFCYAVEEQLAEGSWNMLAIAVEPERQNAGAGRALTEALEADLRSRAARILIADTSGTEGFVATRAFYAARGYAEEARIRDYWAAGDDKVTFWKAL